jgi:hypothetical protein
MPSYSEDIIDEARAETRATLQRSNTFANLPDDDKIRLYKDMLDANAKRVATARGLSVPNGNGYAIEQAKRSADLINEKRHENSNLDKVGERAEDFLDAVDFPGFVRDLLKAVFDANLQVTTTQMETYQKLLKTATASVSKFVNQIDDTAAFGYLAENNEDEFSMTFDDDKKEDDGTAKAQLTDKEGNKMDLGDNEVKAKIMDAKIAMAREQRALLREMMLMGITRLVVEKGTIKAGVVFDVKSTENIVRKDRAGVRKTQANSHTASARTGFLTNLVGGMSGGTTNTKKKSEISVSTTESTSSTDLKAKLTGSVEIIFKSDYFKLDNFAAMYAPQPGADGGAGGAANAGATTPGAKK